MRLPAIEKRKRIQSKAISVATEIGVDEGLTGITARRVAKGTGCSVGTLYNVFGSLDELILQVNAQTLDGLFNALSAKDLSENPEVAMLEVIEVYQHYTKQNAKLWGVIFEHIWPANFVIPVSYIEKIQRLLDLLAKTIKPFLPKLSDAELAQAAAVLWSGLHGINSLAVSGKTGLVSTSTVSEMTEVLVHNFVRGLVAAQTDSAG